MPELVSEEVAQGVLVVGDSQAGKASLLKKIPGATLIVDGSGGTLELDTKYYTASTTFVFVGGSHPVPSGSDTPEALILVFDCTRRASFEFVKAWAQPKTGLTAAEVRLCVATKLDRLSQAADAQRAAWLEDARTWCSEELIEYVEAAPEDPVLDSALQLDGEKQGVRRILAALQACMWPGLVRKPSQPAAAASDATEGNSSSLSGLAASDSLTHAAAASQEASDPPCSEEELEQQMDGFEKLLGDIAGARGRLQDLPDAERRAAAESLTLSILSRLNMDDSDASDSDSE